jgi:hypothetical protein
MDQPLVFSQPHFHIRWTHKTTLDWECFLTHSEASIRAAELAEPEEIFEIEEVSSDCPMLRKNLPWGINPQNSK